MKTDAETHPFCFKGKDMDNLTSSNKVSYCYLRLHNGKEIDFKDALNIPIIFNPVLDETLDSGSIKLSDLRREDYPEIDVSRPFEPFSLVRIGFDGQKTEIRLLLWHDDVKMQRKDFQYKSWSHSLTLIEETKLLERISVDTLTFTNPLSRENDKEIDAEWEAYHFNNNMGSNINPLMWKPPALKKLYDPGTTVSICSNASTIDPNNNFYLKEGGDEGIILEIKKPSGRTSKYYMGPYSRYNGKYKNETIKFVLSEKGSYELKFTFSSNTNGLQYMTMTTTITTVATDVHNYTIGEAINRLLNLTPTRLLNECNKFTFDKEQLEKFKTEESPEFAFTGHTLFEALLLIAGYKGSFPMLKGDVISFRPLWNGEYEISPSFLRGELIDETSSSDGEQYCTYIETEVQNLVGINDSGNATITEPYAGGYKTTRSGEGCAITDDTVVISTSYNIYQSISLEMGWIGDSSKNIEVGDLANYIYEEGEYEGLSDMRYNYPYSKAYALKWSQMEEGFTELSHRIKSKEKIDGAFIKPAIENIVYSKTGEMWVADYIKQLFGDENGSLSNIMFRPSYIPIFNTRVKQYKDNFADFHYDGSIKYNQSAELVDSELYGEHLKQLIRKIGNATKRCVYKFAKIDDVPEVGTMVVFTDDYGYNEEEYVVYDVAMSIRENEVIATVSWVKYAELSRYIGVKNAWKDSDVSVSKCYNRVVSYNEFLLFSHDSEKQGTSTAISSAALKKIINLDNSVGGRITCAEGTGKKENGNPISTVLLPVISLAMGNSLFFQWRYKNNYSAGYMSEDAPAGATSALSGTRYNRAQKAVKYCDDLGRLYSYDFALMPAGPVADGNVGWGNSGSVDTDKMSVATKIGHSLPYKAEQIFDKSADHDWQGEKYISVKDLLVDKNSSEALTFTAQLHFCSDDTHFIVGSGLTNFCPLIGGEVQEIGLYGAFERLNSFKRRVPKQEVEEKKGYFEKIDGEIKCQVNEQKNRIEITLPDINGYQAWVVLGKDKNGNYQILFGENRDIYSSDFETELYLYPMHKLEDFI